MSQSEHVEQSPEPEARIKLMVGLGASAGALEPLQELLKNVPARSGLVFVVVQHLDPHHPSMLTELLGRHTTLPVHQATDGVTPVADHVYVIPPGTLLTIDKGVLHVAAHTTPGSSIDTFLHSLARDQGDQAAAVLLSGAGHYGTVGLRAIKEHGGFTLAQHPETAKHDRMVQSAIGAGLVDLILPVAQMPVALLDHAERLTRLARVGGAENLDQQVAARLGAICSLSQSAVINQRGDVLFVAGPIARHLQLPAGALTTPNLLESFRGSLRQELRMALRSAAETSRKIVRKNLCIEAADAARRVHLTVRPVPGVEPDAGLFLVALQEVELPAESESDAVATGTAQPVSEQLEDELRATRAQLRVTVEELESVHEEMKSSNEDLISANEELQSANEEMQTSKEELQSLNEELETVNTELRQKVDELDAANSDLQNLFAATQIATVFLDRSLRVVKFTPAATALFHLIDTDVGRPLADFAQRFAGQDLFVDAQTVLRQLAPIERQVRSADGHWFVVRIGPYRTIENVIAGVVVTFVDVTEFKRAEEDVMARVLEANSEITERKRAEEEQRRLSSELANRVGELQAILDHAPIAIWIAHDPGCQTITGNAFADQVIMQTDAGANISRSAPPDATPVSFKVVRDGVEIAPEQLPAQIAAATGKSVPGEEMELVFSDGRRVPMILGATPLFDAEGRPRGSVTAGVEVTRLKHAEEALIESNRRTTAILESIADAFYSLDDQWRFVVINPAAERAPFGRPASELLGKVIWDEFPGIPGTRIHQHYLDAVQKRRQEHYEARSPLNDRWYEVFMFPRTGGLDVYMRDITERKEVEEALRSSEEKFARAFHGNNAAMAITRLSDGLFIDVNDRYLEVTGWTREEVIGQKSTRFSIYKCPEDRDRFVRELRAHGEVRNAEYRYLRKGGEEWTGLVSSQVGTLGGEQVTISSIVDVTERKKAEEALRESEQRFRLALRNAPVSVAAQDRDLRYIWAFNPRTAQPEQIIGKRDDELLTPEEAARVTLIKQRVLDEGVELREQMWFDRPDGRRFLDLCWEPIRDPSGRVTGVASATVDLTSTQQAEEALRESEHRYRTLFETMTEGFSIAEVLFDREGNPCDVRYLSVNPAFERHSGLKGSAVIGHTLFELFPQAEPVWVQRFGNVVLTGEPAHFEAQFGSLGPWIEVRAFQMEGARFAIVFMDITERKRAVDALREADQRKNEFLAVLSHELRNPLTPIRNSLYILEHAVPGGDQARRAQEVIGRQSDQLARLVDDLLDITRISRNKIQLHRATLDLNDLVRRALEDHHSLFLHGELTVESDLAAEQLPIHGDAARLTQMVGNLLQNAAKFTPPGGRVRVSTSAARSRGRAMLRVLDDGVGIEATILHRLFQPFMQADATLDRSKGGLGLGLALVKGLVEMHGGEVCAHSDGTGKGAEFVVELPLEDAVVAETKPVTGAVRGSRLRVLIIEDNIDAANSLRDVLEFGEHEVEVAYSGQDGLATAREFRPDVVLCDIGLPGMDGYEVAQAFRVDERLKDVFLVALSGYALPEDLQRAHEAGFHRHLAKPASMEKLQELLASLGS